MISLVFDNKRATDNSSFPKLTIQWLIAKAKKQNNSAVHLINRGMPRHNEELKQTLTGTDWLPTKRPASWHWAFWCNDSNPSLVVMYFSDSGSRLSVLSVSGLIPVCAAWRDTRPYLRGDERLMWPNVFKLRFYLCYNWSLRCKLKHVLFHIVSIGITGFLFLLLIWVLGRNVD